MREPMTTAELARELEAVDAGRQPRTIALSVDLVDVVRTRNDEPGNIEIICRTAQLCHELNRLWCESHGDYTQPFWPDAPEWQRTSAIEGVLKILTGEIRTPEDAHASWTEAKLRDGWTFGPVKDPEQRTHPCLVPYHELPLEQRDKDAVFFTVGRTLAPLVTGDRHT